MFVVENNAINKTCIQTNNIRKRHNSLVGHFIKHHSKKLSLGPSSKLLITENQSHNLIKNALSKNPSSRRLFPFCQYKGFSKMKTSKSMIYVNIGSPYKTKEELQNEEYKKSKEKWLTNKGFIASGDKNCKGYMIIENYVGKDPSEPQVLHKFREVNKSKWISKTFKLS